MKAAIRQLWGKTFQRGKVETRLVHWTCLRCGEQWSTERLWWPYDSERTNWATLCIKRPLCRNGHSQVLLSTKKIEKEKA